MTEHHHDHEHTHEHHSHEHHHPHEHRGLPDILKIIDGAQMTDRAKEYAKRIFDILARAESKAHGVPVDQVHFHEVGAVDSIVDILSVAICLDNLDIEEACIPYICEGRGTIRCQHGILPVPVPAVANIVSAEGLTLHMTTVDGELVTPTGAAIVAAIRTSEKLPEKFKVVATGIGAGKREYEAPGILRAMIIEADEEDSDAICKLETNIDDCSGEVLGYVMDCLFEAGARDVHYHPIFMKKNRPAYQLNVICDKETIPALEAIIFKETTTIGIRESEMNRAVLKREATTCQTPYGEMTVKSCTLPDGTVRKYPEYDSAVKLAKENNVSLQDIMRSCK